MSPPRRLQKRRTRGWRTPPGAVYVGRPTVFGNPFRPGDRPDLAPEAARRWAVGRYREYLASGADGAARVLSRLVELRGRDLLCWCPLPAPREDDVCHAAVLLALANAPEP